MILLLRDDITSITDEQLQEMLAALPSWRREQALRYKFRMGQVECAVAYLLLAKGLSEHFGIKHALDFHIGDHGKPQLTNNPHIHFNLSHCKKAVAAIIDTHQVGIDVECIRPYNEAVARYTMNEDEMQYITAHPSPAYAFTRLWTQKEAVCKALGTGITDELPHLLRCAHEKGIRVHTHEVDAAKEYLCSWAEQL
ncbi:MAG: 4'-phosphopantetheinyl transferase superfamily protein [Bacteroidales bacterium]|nr:4'-phosphopantetheinyl transferase superfamily protein [Candidatus Physcousia equi]